MLNKISFNNAFYKIVQRNYKYYEFKLKMAQICSSHVSIFTKVILQSLRYLCKNILDNQIITGMPLLSFLNG